MVHLIIICALILSAIPLLLLYIEDVEVTLSIKHKALGKDARASDRRFEPMKFEGKRHYDSNYLIDRLNQDLKNRESFSQDDSFIQDEKPLFERLNNRDKIKTRLDSFARKAEYENVMGNRDPRLPGERGNGYTISSASKLDKEREKHGYDKHAFNQLVSDRISLYRSLKDYRNPV